MGHVAGHDGEEAGQRGSQLGADRMAEPAQVAPARRRLQRLDEHSGREQLIA
jgi:hypothetical protein